MISQLVPSWLSIRLCSTGRFRPTAGRWLGEQVDVRWVGGLVRGQAGGCRSASGAAWPPDAMGAYPAGRVRPGGPEGGQAQSISQARWAILERVRVQSSGQYRSGEGRRRSGSSRYGLHRPSARLNGPGSLRP